jgi:hypothetical protein
LKCISAIGAPGDGDGLDVGSNGTFIAYGKSSICTATEGDQELQRLDFANVPVDVAFWILLGFLLGTRRYQAVVGGACVFDYKEESRVDDNDRWGKVQVFCGEGCCWKEGEEKGWKVLRDGFDVL